MEKSHAKKASLDPHIIQEEYRLWKEQGLNLDMSRGKPGAAQLDMVSDILKYPSSPEECFDGGIDVRNYGHLRGIPSAKKLFAELLGCRPSQVLAGGSSSLQLMYDTISKAMTHGLLHSSGPWMKQPKLKWLCPSPGYDRHFQITESFGFEQIVIPMTSNGPDMDMVEKYIQDPTVKGIWVVPKYSNPMGVIYSDDTIRRLASMKPAAKDFLLMWDNAYCVHEIEGDFRPFPDILSLATEAGNPDMVYEFASTSKITLPGAGVACMATSEANLDHICRLMNVQLISFDKVNQLRHVLYLRDKAHTLELMKKHAAILKPKFDAVLALLEQEIEPLGIASWEKPKGGYFIAVRTLPGLAARTLELCQEAGVVMTKAGAVFPGGVDPDDCWIRIAPSLPPTDELEKAMHIFCSSLKLAWLEKGSPLFDSFQ